MAYTELPTYFAPGAFELTRTDYTGIVYNTDLLAEAYGFMRDEAGIDLPDNPEDLNYVVRYAAAGSIRAEQDQNFSRARPDALYVPAGQLALAVNETPSTITKAQITADSKRIAQLQIQSAHTSWAGALAESFIYPPAEDMRMLSSPSAWIGQIATAFAIGRPSEDTNKRVVQEVATRFAGAICPLPRLS